jgi:hypothetical protein
MEHSISRIRFPVLNMATNDTPPTSLGPRQIQEYAAIIAKRHGILTRQAFPLVERYTRRSAAHGFCDGWWLKLLDAQFQTRIGPHRRIRCGQEAQLAHLIPRLGELCHDCGCALGEYHVFGCDSEECSRCGGQAFCCDCDTGASDRA